MGSSAIKRILLVLGALIFASSIGLGVSAQEQGGGSGLVISPTRTELEIIPGSTEKLKITLQNVSGVDIIAKAQVNDFESNGKTGEPKIFPNSEKQTSASVRNFLTNVQDIPLKKDEKKDFEIDIAVPANAAPGAYYGIVRYAAVPAVAAEATDRQISLTASVGTLVLLTVPGDITEQIQLQSLRAENVDGSGNATARSFFTKKPTQVSAEIKNNGNGFSKPIGRISILKGGKEVFSYELNGTEPRANILPNSTRIFSNNIEKVNTPGRYKVSANISHGSGGEVITTESSFWYVPMWCFYVLAGLLLALIALGYLVYRKKFSGRSAKKSRR